MKEDNKDSKAPKAAPKPVASGDDGLRDRAGVWRFRRKPTRERVDPPDLDRAPELRANPVETQDWHRKKPV